MAPRNFMSPAFLLRFPCKSLQGPPISSLGPTKSLPPSTTKAKPGSTPSGPLATRTCSRFRPTLPAKSPPPTPARPRSPPTSMASSPIFRSRLLLILCKSRPEQQRCSSAIHANSLSSMNAASPALSPRWSVDNQGLASVTTDPSTTLTALAAGTVNLSATVEGVSMQIPVTISGATSFAPGTVLWSAPPAPGFTPQGLFQAVPTDTGPSLYSVQAATGAIQTLVQAFTSDGQQLWQTALNSSCAGFSAPDGNGGVLATWTVSNIN